MKRHAYALFYRAWLELKRIIFRVKYSAEVDVTDNCNLRCKHCYHFHGKDCFETQELPIHVWEKRFNELYKSGIRHILLVGVSLRSGMMFSCSLTEFFLLYTLLQTEQ